MASSGWFGAELCRESGNVHKKVCVQKSVHVATFIPTDVGFEMLNVMMVRVLRTRRSLPGNGPCGAGNGPCAARNGPCLDSPAYPARRSHPTGLLRSQ